MVSGRDGVLVLPTGVCTDSYRAADPFPPSLSSSSTSSHRGNDSRPPAPSAPSFFRLSRPSGVPSFSRSTLVTDETEVS